MHIEPYSTRHDTGKILRLDKQAVLPFLDQLENSYSQDDLTNIKNEYETKGGALYLGFEEDCIIAMCGYLPIDTLTVKLMRLRVDNTMQNRGLGSQILVFVENKIRRAGFGKIVLRTAAVRIPTLLFYRKHGYTETGTGLKGNLRLICFEKNL